MKRYVKEVFDVATIDHAKHVVLTSDPNNPAKFEQETNFLIDAIQQQKIINDNSVVLDFGCGMGRVSKQLINTFNCTVVGVDISESMLKFAMLYIAKPQRFRFGTSYSIPESIDVGISTFVLQHTENPIKEIENIYNVIKPGGWFILLNENKRFVPSDVDSNNFVIWNDDGVDIHNEVGKRFVERHRVRYCLTDTYIVFYQKEV